MTVVIELIKKGPIINAAGIKTNNQLINSKKKLLFFFSSIICFFKSKFVKKYYS
jgi:hypothetical protein